MKQAQRKSFDWYKMQQRFSIRKYHFGAASVLLGTALVLGTAVNTQAVQAEEHNPEATNSVSVDKIAETTKPAEVSTAKKETAYPAPTVVNPVEVTPAKSEAVKATVEKVEEPKVEKEEVSHQSAVDKSKLLTALSRAKKLEAKLYTEASVANLKASIQAGQSLLGKADATEAELSAAESSIQSAVIGLELRSNSDKGTVSETPVAKKADAAEAKEEAKPAATTTDRSVLDSAVLPTSRAAIVEAFLAPKTTNEILKPGLSLSDAHQNPAIRKEDLDKGQSGFRASSNPANPIVSGSGNTVAFTDISQAGRSYSFRGYGNARGGHSIHYDVTTVRQGNRLNFTIQYSGPGEFVNNNFILDKGDGFGNPSNATITTPRLREQSKPISQGANFVSHSGYTMTSATETSMQQTIRFSLPINNPNGDLSVRLKPVTFNVDQGGGGAATSNDPYSNSNYYYRANPLYLDANPNGGSSNKVITEDIDFQTVYLPTSKLPEGQTRLVREGEKGQRQITYKVHRFGNETLLGLPISNSVTKEAKPRIMQIGVAKELIDTVKPRVDQNKVGDTNNLTFYLDNDGNGVYTEGVDELVQRIAIKDGAKGEKGNQGERGLTGAQGAQGAKGEKGDRGERGLTGAQGAKGEKGDRGERGLTGAQGAKGEKGDRGERGLTGAKGEKGDRGERGLTGAKGEKGDRGERGLTGAQGQAGRDGVTPTVTVKDNKDDGTHTITINDGRGNVTSTVVRDGFDGASPLVATQRNDADKTTTVIFYYDQNDNNEFDADDTKLKEVVIADGAKGEKGDQGERGLTGAQGEKGERGDRGETGAAGRDGKTPKITTARGADGRSTDITFTIPGEEPVVANIKDGKDGRTPNIDLNALAEAAVRLNNQRSGRVRRALADAPSTASAPQPVEGTRITAYYDNNGNGKYDPGVDELIGTSDILNGTNGRNGADGASGTDGRNGAELLSGPKAPIANDGKDGDTYIDATTGDVYKKEGRNWNQIGNIRGPQGLPGSKGDKGENGKDGFTPEVTVTDNHDGSHTITVTQPEGRPALTTIVKNGVDGQTPKVKAVRDEAKKQTTLTFYIDKDGDGNYTEGTDTLVQTSIVKDGQDGAAGQAGRDGKEVLNGKVDPQPRDGKDGDSFVNTATGDVFVKKNNTWEQAGNIKGPKGDKGENGRDGFTPEVTVTDNHDGSHAITVTQPEGRPALTTIVKNGVDGQTPKVKAERDEAKKQTTLTFYIDKDGDGNYTEGTDTLVQTSIVKDGQDGAAGQAGRDGKEVLNGKVDPQPRDGKDGDSFVNTATGDVFVKKNNTWEQAGNIKGPKGDKGENGRDGFTPEVTVTDNHDGSHAITVTQPEGRPALTTIVKNGVDGQTPKVKAERDEAKKQTTLTFYIDKDGDGNYTEGTDTLVQTSIVKDGQDGAAGQAGRDGKEVLNGKVDPQPRDGKDGDSFVNTATGDVFVKKNNTWEQAGNIKGPKGDKGENGRDGFTPEVTVTDNHDGSHTITVTQPEGRPALTTIVKNGVDGQTPKVKAVRDEAKKQTTLTFYIDKDGDGNYTEGTDTLVQTSIVKDGQDGAAGQAGRDGKEVLNGKVDPQPRDGKDGDSFVNTATGDVFVKKNNTWEQAGNIKGPKGDKGENGKDGFTPEVTVTDNHDGSHTITVTQPEGRPALTTIVKNGVDGQTPKVKAVRDEAKKQTTLTFYIDKDGDGNYTEGTDTLVQTSIVKDGQDGAAGQAGRDGKEVLNGKVDPQPRDGKDGDSFVNTATGDVFVKKNNTWEQAGNIKGPKGDKGENGEVGPQGPKGEDGKTPEVTVTPGKDGHSSDITFTVPGKTPVTVNVKNGENGLNGKTPKVDLLRVEGQNGNPSHTIVTFYTDENGDGKYTVGTDELLGSEMIKDGAKGADGRDGKSLLTVKEGKETKVYQEDPANPGQPLTPDRPLAVIRDGIDGKSPTVTAARKEEVDHKGVEITVDNHDGSQPTTVFVHDGAKGETGANGQNGQTPTVTTQRGADGHSTVVTITTPGKEPVTFTVRDGLDGHNGNNGRTPKIDLQPYVNGEDSFRRARRSVGNNPDEVSGHPNSRATSSDNADGTHVTVYFDNNGNNHYDPGVDELISERDVLNGVNGVNGENGASGRDGRNGSELLSGNIAPTPKDGKNGDTYIDSSTGDVYKKQNGAWNKTGNIRGPQGAKGDTPEVTAKPGADGHSTDITITTPGKDPVTVNVKNGKDGKSLIAKKEGNETKIFVEDPANPGQPLDSTKPLATVLDGLKGEKGDNGADGKSPVVTMTDNGDGTHSITVRNGDGSESTTKVKDGKDGKTATITTTENPDGSHTITVTNPDGTSKETVVKNGKDGKTPKVEVTDNNDGTHTVKVTDGDGNVTNAIIKDGKDGKAATATTTEHPDGSHTVTITNPDGTKNEFVVKNGRDGVDGRTPTASVRDNGDGSHTIVITNPEGVTTETTVRDGKSPKVTITDEQNGTHKISVLNGDGTTTETIVKDGKSPVATVTDNHDGTYTIRVENGNGTVSETTVRDGKSPTAKVVDNGDGTHTITVVNSDGTTTTTIVRDGKSPKLEVIDNNNGSHTIKVTGADGKETTTTIFDGKSPKANIVDNGDGTHTLTIVDSDGREYKSIIKDGKDGKDGVSPTVTVKNNNDGTHVVTIINPDGSKTEMVIKDGKDGKSPKVSVEDNGNGSHTITIINSDGTVTKTVVKDGKDGRDGRDGRDGKDGKDGKCGCQDKPVTPSNDKPVPPTPNVPERPMFAMPEPPVHELPEFNGGVPGMPEVNELSNPEVPGMPTPPVQEIPEFNGGVPGMPEVNDKPTSNIPKVPTQPNSNVPVQPVTPLTSNPVVPTTVKENHGDKLPETGSQSDYISVLLGSGILLSLYVGRRKED